MPLIFLYSFTAPDVSKISDQFENTLNYLQAELVELFQKTIGKQTDKKIIASCKALENRIYSIANRKSVVLKPQEKLQVLVGSLSEKNITIENSELLKSFINSMLSNNSSTDKRFEQMKTLIDVVAEKSISVERYNTLELIVDCLSESSVSHDCIDSVVVQAVKERTSELKELCEKVRQVDNKSSEIQLFMDEVKCENPDLLKMLQTQITIIKTIQSEHESFKLKLTGIMNSIEEKLNGEIAQMMKKMLIELSV